MRLSLACILFFFIFCTPVAAQGKLEQIKAVFLFKFVDYISWPQNSKPPDGGTFILCVWGDHPFDNTLNVIAQKQNQYRYKIKYLPSNQTPRNCHLVFTTMSFNSDWKIDNAFIVSDSTNFARNGGMIEMTEKNGKIKLVGNLRAAEYAGFKISSRLLEIMDVIR